MPNIRLGRHARRWAIVAAIVVVFAGGGATAWAMTGPSGPGYRIATVARSNVTQTLLSTGTIEPVSQANVSFPVSGQVASVSFGLGSHVSAGQVLARLSTTALAAQVSAAQYSVATATVRLAADEASETTTTAYVVSNPTAAGGTSGSGGKSSVAGDQAAILAAQQRLDTQLTAAKSLAAVETSLCAATPAPATSANGVTSPSPRPTPTVTPTPAVTPTPTAVPTPTVTVTVTATPTVTPTSTVTVTVTPTSTVTASAAGLMAVTARPTGTAGGAPAGAPAPTTCQAAITELMSDQASIAATEQSLATSESALTKLLNQAASTAGKSAGSGATGAAGSGSRGGAAGAATAPATAAQLAADQASLDAANAQLSVARQNMSAATLVAPISGTVALVNVTAGQQVTGSQGSGTSADFVIEGTGGEEAATTVSVSDVGEIRVGQPATVTLDGSATSIHGEVVAVGMLSTTSSTGTASYPVTIGLAAGTPTLFAGSDAQVAITLAQVSDAITVPTSAVESVGTATFVTVLKAGKPVRVRVVVGAAGPVLTQVSSGLTVGEQVVLADMGTPLPTNANPFAARGLTGGGGGFGGGRIGTGTTGGSTTTGSGRGPSGG
jgi:HlyD family secretion protein